jgi:hypothetical protein
MASTPLAWGPREGKSLCVIELDLAPDIAFAPYPLDDVLRMCIDFCWWSVFKERRRLDPQPPPPSLLSDFKTFRELRADSERQRENPWIPTLEVIPPTTLFTDCKHPSIRINLGLPPEITVEVRNQYEQMWQELLEDIRQCGVGPFLDLYRKPFGIPGGGPPVKAEYPLNRWGPLRIGVGLICAKNPQQRPVS